MFAKTRSRKEQGGEIHCHIRLYGNILQRRFGLGVSFAARPFHYSVLPSSKLFHLSSKIVLSSRCYSALSTSLDQLQLSLSTHHPLLQLAL